jgi:hypothetical protein
MRMRLRPAWSEAELAAFCPVPHKHTDYRSHIVRVEHTISLGRALLRESQMDGYVSVADLSCGDAVIPRALCDDPVLGDFAPGYPITGMIQDTIADCPPVDLFALSETVEHLDDPDMVLRAIRDKAKRLLLSTPLGEFDDHNEQHYWGWDQDGIRQLLYDSSWTPIVWSTVTGPDAAFQIWGCR